MKSQPQYNRYNVCVHLLLVTLICVSIGLYSTFKKLAALEEEINILKVKHHTELKERDERLELLIDLIPIEEPKE